MLIRIIVVVICMTIFLFIIELIREEKLTFNYAFGWLVFASIGILGAIFEECLHWLTRILGFDLTSNFIFFGVSVFFVFLSLLMTIFLCRQNRRNDLVAQKLGALEFEIRKLKNKKKSFKKGDIEDYEEDSNAEIV